ncbi:MAG: ABC transporter substrate-binding protein [Deltaproteobacteria bacterium]|nr:ABC transporter substrate-binding protein [Deltaproteobacteria bacterium]
MTQWTARRGRAHHIVGILSLLLAFGPIALGCPAPAESGRTASGEGPTKAPRILSLSPLATRFLDQLGLGDRIVPLSPMTPGGSDSPAERAVDFDELARREPDFVFLPALPDDRTELAPLEAAGARIVEFAPHDLEDLLALLQGVGVELAGKQGVEAFERRVLRPVAMVAGQSSPTDRLRVVAVVGIDPPEIAGGHSFETDLIEIAGATSLTHGADDERRPIDRDGLAALKPDLVLVMTGSALTSEQRERVLDLTYGIAPVHDFEFARETFWLDEPVREATRLRELIVAAEREHASADVR